MYSWSLTSERYSWKDRLPHLPKRFGRQLPLMLVDEQLLGRKVYLLVESYLGAIFLKRSSTSSTEAFCWSITFRVGRFATTRYKCIYSRSLTSGRYFWKVGLLHLPKRFGRQLPLMLVDEQLLGRKVYLLVESHLAAIFLKSSSTSSTWRFWSSITFKVGR